MLKKELAEGHCSVDHVVSDLKGEEMFVIIYEFL